MKKHQMLSVNTTLEKFSENSHFGFVLKENSVGEIASLSSRRKAPFSNKRNAGVFKFLRFEERFQIAPFLVRISVDGGPNRRNKAAFSNFSGVV